MYIYVFFAPKFDLSLDQLHAIFTVLNFEIVKFKKAADANKYIVYKVCLNYIFKHTSI